MHRIRVLKSLILLLFVVILFAVQIFLLNGVTINYFIQLFILDLFIFVSIYAFRGFDNSTLKSLNSLVVAYSVGTILGVLLSLVIILFFSNKIGRLIFIVTPLISAFAFPVIIKFLVKNGIKHMDEKRYLVIGNEEEFKDMLSEVEAGSMGRIKIYKYINPSTSTLTNEITGERTFNNILIADPPLAEMVNETLNKAKDLGVSVEYLPNLVEESLKRIPLELVDKYKEYYEVIFSNIYISRRIRVIDILISFFCIILSSPLILISVFLILIKDGKPVLYKQKRLGMNRKEFNAYKFRTMTENNKIDGELEEIRITKSGKILRKFRFNEIPQFFNVLKGDISLVGPRPDLPYFYNKWINDIKFYGYRYNIPAGITGHAQVFYKYCDTREEYVKRLEYDLYYIKNHNVRLYLSTILRTIETIILKRGAK